MKNILTWIDKLPWPNLLILGIVLALLPFNPEPHLWEKVKMLMAFELNKAIDIFDLLMHASGLFLITLKGIRVLSCYKNKRS